jgi:2-isopropylmalate synthase
LKKHGREVVYDAEHFFDGYRNNPGFALRTLEAAKRTGADVLCLCDTNGGTLPDQVAEIVQAVRSRFDGILGIHCHNDSEVAVANTLLAVQAGARHIQGCINGYGERCGNTNLCSVLANLELKLGYTTVGPEKIAGLTQLARFVSDLANLPVRDDQAFVGKSAFAHKGGVHVSAVMKDSATYEHVKPEAVGNRQRVLLSDLSGRGNVLYKLQQLGLEHHMAEPARRELVQRIKLMEHEGYEFETAEGTFELLVREAAHPEFHPFEVVDYEVSTRLERSGSEKLKSDNTVTIASVTLRVDGNVHSHTASGQGPVHALDVCLRQCLASVFPAITSVHLTDYKVRVLGAKGGTESKVRVHVEWTDHSRTWATVGVSNNVIDASWRALVDALRLELMRLIDTQSSQPNARDFSWAV